MKKKYCGGAQLLIIGPLKIGLFKIGLLVLKFFFVIFDEVADKACTDYQYVKSVRCLWQLLCKNKLIHWWSDQSIVEKITNFIRYRKGGPKCFDVRIGMLKSIIQWGLQKNKCYETMPDKCKDLDIYIALYLTNLDYPPHESSCTEPVKALVDLSLQFSKPWNEMTTQYSTGILIRLTMKWCLKDQSWFVEVLQTMSRTNIEVFKLQLMTAFLNKEIKDNTLLGIVQGQFSFNS